MDVCKSIVPLRHGGTLNSRRTSSPLVRLVEEKERWESSDDPQLGYNLDKSSSVAGLLDKCPKTYLLNTRTLHFDHLTPHLPVLTDDVVSRLFISSTALEQAKADNSLGSIHVPRDSTYSGQSFPWLSKALDLLRHDSVFVNECGNNVLCSSERQRGLSVGMTRLTAWRFDHFSHFQGSQHGLEPTVRPQSIHWGVKLHASGAFLKLHVLP
ncbi:hypothetical protein TNCV_4160961 [Trichonephila clavipes]|nr:hypothetical protein TNCV_4160961 [Trichonephila clavipes]